VPTTSLDHLVSAREQWREVLRGRAREAVDKVDNQLEFARLFDGQHRRCGVPFVSRTLLDHLVGAGEERKRDRDP
jgi:hypothetical protein